MKYRSTYSSIIRDIGYDGFFVHFWSNLQLQIYKECYSTITIPTISFDATGGCCRKIKRPENNQSSHLFLYEGVMEVNGKTFTVLSMISEKHDILSICMWLQRWLKCRIKAPKMVICDQSLAVMVAFVKSFTQYNSLEEYLKICYKLVMNTNENIKPTCYVRNDINHFVKLISNWTPLNKSKFPRTKQLFIRSMTLLVYCTSMEEAKKILGAIFTIALSKYDSPLFVSTENAEETPCAISKKYLQSLISEKSSYLQMFDHFIDENVCNNAENQEFDEEENIGEEFSGNFMNWAPLIAENCQQYVNMVEGKYDNTQYMPELVPLVIKSMKLNPCWSGIMKTSFGYGDATASSCRIESNFNQLKNRVFKNDNLPIRVDDFVDKLILYYKGDHLLIKNSDLIMTSPTINNKCYLELDLQSKSNYLDIATDEVMNIEQNLHIESEKELTEQYTEKPNITYLPCKNGHFPTGAHKCAVCNKSVHLFGCSVSNNIHRDEEGYGESRICLSCAEQTKENDAEEY